MLKPDARISLPDPQDKDDFTLLDGTVLAVENGRVVVSLGNVQTAILVDQVLVVYFHQKHRFTSQAARVLAMPLREPELVLQLELIGDPVSADRREHYRVSTLAAGIRVRIAGEENCELVNLSSKGIAAIAHQRYESSAVLAVRLEHGQEAYEGRACVQSVRELTGGRIRYGLYAMADEADGDSLRAGLGTLGNIIEREILRRMSERL